MLSLLALVVGVVLIAIVIGINLFRLWDGNQMYFRAKKKREFEKSQHDSSDADKSR